MVANSLTLENVSGGTVTNYPLKIGRPFARGEIADYPQLVVDGVPVDTQQANVTTRWDDGSVQLCTIPYRFLSLLDSTAVELTFQNQASVNTTAITKTAMLASYDFEATIGLVPYRIFGNPSYLIGGSTTPGANTLNLLRLGVCPVGGFGSTSVIVVPTATNGSAKFKAVAYASSNNTNVGSPTTLLATGTEVVGCTANTPLVLPLSYSFAAGTAYFIGFITDSAVAFATVTPVNEYYVEANTYASGAPSTAPGWSSPKTAIQMYARTADGTPVTISARDMVNANAYTVFSGGPIATTIEIADDTTFAYDPTFSGESYATFHPRITATFWSETNQVEVRFAGENTKTTQLQDIYYDLTLTLGYASPATLFTQRAVRHDYKTVWTQRGWIGGTPEEEINLDHNIAYLASTKVFPNYDPQWVIPDATINALYNSAFSAPMPIGYNANWLRDMGDGGAREDICHIPGFILRWMYSGHWKAKATALANADVAGRWPYSLRESDTGRRLLRTDAVGSSGLGKVMTVADRKTYSSSDPDSVSSGDNVVVHNIPAITALSYENWLNDIAHTPDPYSSTYILTGDPYYLRMLQFIAAQAQYATTYTARGPSPFQWLTFVNTGNVRAMAWALRGSVLAHVCSPDGTAEKDLFFLAVDDQLAAYEGLERVAGGHYVGHPVRQFWSTHATIINPVGDPDAEDHDAFDPLGLFQRPYLDEGGPAYKPWMVGFNILELAFAKDLGYNSDKVLSCLAQMYIGQVTDPDWPSPFSINEYVWNAWIDRDGGAPTNFFKTWADMALDSFNAALFVAFPELIDGPLDIMNDLTGRYSLIAMACLSMTTGEPNGLEAWNWVKTNGYDLSDFSTNPSWALIPRVAGEVSTGSNYYPGAYYPLAYYDRAYYPTKPDNPPIVSTGNIYYGQAYYPNFFYPSSYYPLKASEIIFTSPASYTIAENTTGTWATCTVVGGTGPVVFDFTGTANSPDQVFFGITDDGEIFTLPGFVVDYDIPLDANHDNVYQVEVSATNAQDESTRQIITFTITNIDEPPVFSGSSSITVESGTTFVTNLAAIDPENASLTWSIVGGADQGKFALVGTVLSFQSPPDYDSPTDADSNNVYVVQVRVTDGTTPVTTTLNVTVAPVPILHGHTGLFRNVGRMLH